MFELLSIYYEIFLQVIYYALALFVGGWICFCFLFPMIGRWIINLNCRLQNRIAKLKAEEDQRKIKDFEDGVKKRYIDTEQEEGMRWEEKFWEGERKRIEQEKNSRS